jgi:hypothetical protein
MSGMGGERFVSTLSFMPPILGRHQRDEGGV